MYFLHNAHINLPAPGDTTQHFGTTLGDHFKKGNHQHAAQKCKEVALNRPKKVHLFTVWDFKQEGRIISSIQSQLEICALDNSDSSPFCTCPQITVKMTWILTWVLEINFNN